MLIPIVSEIDISVTSGSLAVAVAELILLTDRVYSQVAMVVVVSAVLLTDQILLV
jgi:hypothetical protein